MNDREQTAEQFITARHLTMTAARIPERKDIPSDTWSKDARHWKCTVRVSIPIAEIMPGDNVHHNTPMVVYYSQGSAHTENPTLADVLDCLASDVSGIDGQSFEAWASDYGYTCVTCGQPTKGAERIFHKIEEQRDDLTKLIGADALEVLLYEVERL